MFWGCLLVGKTKLTLEIQGPISPKALGEWRAGRFQEGRASMV